MELPDQPPQGADWNRWRGKVDTTLTQVDTRLSSVEGEVKDTNKTLSSMPAEIVKAIKNGEQASPPGNGRPVSYKWIAEKLLLPIVILVAAAVVAAAMGGML